MKSTHNTAFAYAKDIAAGCVMAVGTAILIAWAGDIGTSSLQNDAHRQLDAVIQVEPEQLAALKARQARLRLIKNMRAATPL